MGNQLLTCSRRLIHHMLTFALRSPLSHGLATICHAATAQLKTPRLLTPLAKLRDKTPKSRPIGKAKDVRCRSQYPVNVNKANIGSV